MPLSRSQKSNVKVLAALGAPFLDSDLGILGMVHIVDAQPDGHALYVAFRIVVCVAVVVEWSEEFCVGVMEAMVYLAY